MYQAYDPTAYRPVLEYVGAIAALMAVSVAGIWLIAALMALTRSTTLAVVPGDAVSLLVLVTVTTAA